jgi:cell division protein FtsI (penicillin-binding protein 3)
MVEVGTAGHAFVGVRNVTDAERSPKPVLNVKECFAHSSNVGMSKLALKAFGENLGGFKSYLQKFHLDRRSGIDLLGEEAPVLPDLRKSYGGLSNMLTASFGYAIEVSPLHTLMLYNAVANNGKMMKPYLVNSIRSNGITIKEVQPTVLDEQITKPDVIKAAKSAMEAVVTEGTAKAVFTDCPFPVAGKTGTAHVAGGGIKYHHGVYQASFAGYFPADNPEYTCIVVVKTKPHAAMHYGGQLAAPVFKEVAVKLYAMYVEGKKLKQPAIVKDSAYFTYAGNSKDVKQVINSLKVKHADSSNKDWSVVYANNSFNPVIKPLATSKNTMPELKGMTMKDALYALEELGLKVSVKGKGKVVAQDILAGTTIRKNQSVTILLN